MTMSSEIKEIAVGLLVFLGLAMVLLLSFGGGQRQTGDGLVLRATFQRVDGLAVGDEVQLGGVRIGSVVRQRLTDEGYGAEIVMRIDAGIDLPSDTSAAIRTDGLFGGKLVDLSPGGEETLLKSGDRITFTQDSLVVEDLLEMIINEGRALHAREQEAEN